MGKTCYCLLAVALMISLGPNVEVKAMRSCKKPRGFPGDLAKCNGKGKWEREYPLKKIEETVVENGEKLDDLLRTEATDQDCAMVVFGNYWWSDAFPLVFIPDHVVTNEEDFSHSYQGKESTNYWRADDRKTGEDTHIFMAFQCPRTIKGFLLKNAHNANTNDIGTQDFTISISDNIDDGPWTDILTGTLPDARHVTPVPVLNFELENEVETQYVRFQVDSYYGFAGALQYWSTY